MVSPVWVLRKDRDFSGSGRGAAEAHARAAGKATASAESAAVFKNPRRQMDWLDGWEAAAARLVKRFSSQIVGFYAYPIILPETSRVLKSPNPTAGEQQGVEMTANSVNEIAPVSDAGRNGGMNRPGAATRTCVRAHNAEP